MITNPAQINFIEIAAAYAAHVIDSYREGKIEKIASYVAGKESVQVALEMDQLGDKYKELAPEVIETLETLIAGEAGAETGIEPAYTVAIYATA